jgi:hypothetical protein
MRIPSSVLFLVTLFVPSAFAQNLQTAVASASETVNGLPSIPPTLAVASAPMLMAAAPAPAPAPAAAPAPVAAAAVAVPVAAAVAAPVAAAATAATPAPAAVDYATLRDHIASWNKLLHDRVSVQREDLKKNQDLLKEAQKIGASNLKLAEEQKRLQAQGNELLKQAETVVNSQKPVESSY